MSNSSVALTSGFAARAANRELSGGCQQGRRCILAVILLVLSLGTLLASGAVTRTQMLELSEGWNAVYLDVDPLVRDPEKVFANTPVDIVASFDGAEFTQQFTSNPSADLLQEMGWATWYAPSRSDSFLSKLGAVYGKKSYLIHATAAVEVGVSGTVACTPRIWQANAFNLIGYPLDELAAPTFAEFFSGSRAHSNPRVYRLINGVWNKVVNPASTAMKSGEAFWIYTDGPSVYQGPLEVTCGVGGVALLREGQTENLILKNSTPYPLNPSIEHVVADGAVFPLAVVVDVVGGVWEGVAKVPVALGDAGWQVGLPPLGAGAGCKIPLTVRADQLEQAQAESLICVKSELGTEVWVPIVGFREDLK
ncbi:MAG: hypothetical protein PHO37_18960 [Kiritimatiellae bacterium]|nr:hypothetical protein [Kiritimatiellia bacterium]